jgi:uroporphyrinogen III methyltransferase/synthase
VPRRATGRAVVYLVGAGPGDPGLITARGIECLSRADVVLYDSLVHPELLEHAEGAELVFVGKRAGRTSARQAFINETMRERVERGQIVVRLKGGDPYLFGRGSEEAEYLHEHGIDFEVVPGVPSPLAASAYAGFSLTHRHLASSVAYLTATESPEKDRESHDWSKLATGPETLVVFMGLGRLRSLMALLVEHGRSPSTPVALVQDASLPTQRTVTGTVGDIADRAEREDLHTPVLIVVGEVVSLRESLRWFDRKPLFGKRVLVTRPEEQARTLTALLREEGAEAIELATIKIAPPDDPGALVEAVANLGGYDAVLFTSRNGVLRFFEEIARQGGDARRFGGAKVAAIGPATSAELARFGIRPDIVPSEFRGEALASELLAAGIREGARVLLPRAAVARDVLPETLKSAGAKVDVVPAYRTVSPSADVVERLRRLVFDGAVDIVTLTSSSTIQNLVSLLGDGAAGALAKLTVASIGPITTETAEKLGVRVDVTAAEYDNAGLVRALRSHYAREASP